jgi:hypothetical protein
MTCFPGDGDLLSVIFARTCERASRRVGGGRRIGASLLDRRTKILCRTPSHPRHGTGERRHPLPERYLSDGGANHRSSREFAAVATVTNMRTCDSSERRIGSDIYMKEALSLWRRRN